MMIAAVLAATCVVVALLVVVLLLIGLLLMESALVAPRASDDPKFEPQPAKPVYDEHPYWRPPLVEEGPADAVRTAL